MDKPVSDYKELKKFAFTCGVDLFGVAQLHEEKKDFLLPKRVVDKVDKAVVIGLRLSEANLDEIEGAPTRLYFHHYRTANTILDEMAFRIGSYIQKKGGYAISIPASLVLDWQKHTSHVPHKKLGFLAGLGWIGRNNLLVNKELGSHFRLASILTDMPLKIDKPTKDDCGACQACITLCPAGAIQEKPSDFNHMKCFDQLKDWQRKRVAEQFICGVCVNACRGKKK